MQMRAPQKAANVALHTYDRVNNEIRIPRWQTVRSVSIHAPERDILLAASRDYSRRHPQPQRVADHAHRDSAIAAAAMIGESSRPNSG